VASVLALEATGRSLPRGTRHLARRFRSGDPRGHGLVAGTETHRAIRAGVRRGTV